jgi:hypothetical protein
MERPAENFGYGRVTTMIATKERKGVNTTTVVENHVMSSNGSMNPYHFKIL